MPIAKVYILDITLFQSKYANWTAWNFSVGKCKKAWSLLIYRKFSLSTKDMHFQYFYSYSEIKKPNCIFKPIRTWDWPFIYHQQRTLCLKMVFSKENCLNGMNQGESGQQIGFHILYFEKVASKSVYIFLINFVIYKILFSINFNAFYVMRSEYILFAYCDGWQYS